MRRQEGCLGATTPVVVVDFFGDLDPDSFRFHSTCCCPESSVAWTVQTQTRCDGEDEKVVILDPARVVARRSWFLLPEDGLLRRFL